MSSKKGPKGKGKRTIKKRRFWPSPPLLIMLGLSMFWSVSMFLAPALLEPGTVVGLDGTSNIVDYEEKWDELDPYTGGSYYFGDSQCHQKETRSFKINGNQMPVCARVFSIFFFGTIGLSFMLFVKPERNVSDQVLFFLPKKFRQRLGRGPGLGLLAVAFMLLMTLPVIIDGFTQMLTPYESTNFMRLLTGLTMGTAGGIVIGALFSNIWYSIYLPEKAMQESKAAKPTIGEKK